MGPNYSISTACATANYCFVAAANHIRKGDADIIIAGGSEAPIIPVGVGGFVACRYLAHAPLPPTLLPPLPPPGRPRAPCSSRFGPRCSSVMDKGVRITTCSQYLANGEVFSLSLSVHFCMFRYSNSDGLGPLSLQTSLKFFLALSKPWCPSTSHKNRQTAPRAS